MLNDRILITGGTGTLGSEIVRQLYDYAKSITILSRDVFRQQELKQLFPRINCVLGDMRSVCFGNNAVYDVIIHTAAMKYIDVAEKNIDECITTNINGTVRLIDWIRDRRLIPKAIFISTDKAVKAISVYGATKLIGERMWLNADDKIQGKFSVIRSGNIFASRGSIIPKWIKAASEGNPIFVNRDMKRLWISVQGLAAYIISKIDTMQGGEVFIPECTERTMLSIAEEINARYGNMSDIKFTDGKPYEKTCEVLS